MGLRSKPKLRNFRIYLITDRYVHQNELIGPQRGLLINWHNVSSGYAYVLRSLQVHNVEILKGSVPLIRLTAEHRVSGKWRCVRIYTSDPLVSHGGNKWGFPLWQCSGMQHCSSPGHTYRNAGKHVGWVAWIARTRAWVTQHSPHTYTFINVSLNNAFSLDEWLLQRINPIKTTRWLWLILQEKNVKPLFWACGRSPSRN